MAEAMSQDSDTGATAAQLEAKYGDLEDASKTPPRDDDDTPPAWLDEAAAILNKPAGPPANNPPAAAPGAMAAALLPIRSESSQLVEQMGALAASAAAATPDNKPAGPSQSGAPGGKPGDEDGDASTDDSDDDELTPEEKEKAEHVKKVEAVIAAAEGAGFTFIAKTRWLAAEAYVNNKKLFDDAGVDITECIKQDSKAINSKRVNAKIAELRAAVEQCALGHPAGGLSQEAIGTEDEEEEEEDAAESDDEFEGLSKQSLDAKLEQLTIQLAVAEKKKESDPIRIAFRQFNKELITLKGSLQYDGKAKELKMIRDYYNERYFEEEFTESLSVWQLKYMSDMFLAEIEKRALPAEIKDLKKHLGKVKSALRDIKFQQMEKQDAKKSDKTAKRAQAAVDAIGTPGKQREVKRMRR
jgi:hypothetical protein